MKYIVLLASLFVLLVAGEASAQSCNKRMTSPTVSSTMLPKYGSIATWLEWLNNGTYTCVASGSTDVVCTKTTNSSEKYWLKLYSCDGSGWCSAHVDSTSGYRNGVSWQNGSSVTSFNFDNGSHGTIQLVCTPDLNNLNNPCVWSWKACWQ